MEIPTHIQSLKYSHHIHTYYTTRMMLLISTTHNNP